MSTPSSGPSKAERRLKQAVWASAIAFVLHLIPILWMTESIETRLSVARGTSDLIKRAEMLRPIEQDEDATPAQLREAAALLLEAGASGDARYLAEEAVRRDPRSFDTQLLLANIFVAERMPNALERSIASASALVPSDPRPQLVLARYLSREGDPQGAIAALRQARAKAPGAVEIHLNLARLLIENGQLEEAEALLVQEGQSAEQLVMLGTLRWKQERLVEAIQLLEQALLSDPKNGEGHYSLGAVLYQRGELRRAEEEFRAAERYSPDDFRPLAALCTIQADTGRIDAARATGIELRRRFPSQSASLKGACRGG